MQQQTSFLDLLSGKTYQEPLAATREKTSKPSSKRFVASGGGQDHIVPMPPKNKWLPFGTIVGDGWSVAWRVYDAQYWGVPQRRKRIYLIADFGSERAGEILSFSEGMCGYPAQSGEAREGTASDVEGSVGRSDSVKCLNPWDCQSKRQYSVDGVYRTLDAGQCKGGQAHGICYPAAFMGGQGAKARSIAYCKDGTTPTLKSAPSGRNTVPDVVYPINTMVATRGGKDDMRTCFGVGEPNDPQFTISAAHQHAVCFQCCGDRKDPSVCVSDKAYCLPANPMSDRQQAVCFQQNQRDEVRNMGEQSGALTAEPGTHNQNYLCYPDVAHSLCARHDSSPCIDRGQNFICVQNTGRGWWNEGEVAETLRTPCGGDSTKANLVVAIDCRNMCANDELSGTLQAKNQGGHSLNFINPIVYDGRGNGDGQIVPTLTGDHNNRVTDYTSLTVAHCQSMSEYAIDGTASTLKARDFKGGAVDVAIEKKQPRKYIVRRLTPTECARIQGFPDWWTDGADGSDSAKYKLWGNGIALPCAEDVIGRIARALHE